MRAFWYHRKFPLRETLGRRGELLITFGLLWILFGGSILFTESGMQVSGLLHTYLPIWLRVTLWATTGALALWAAVWQTPRWQAVGFAALVIMPMERALSYLSAWGMDLRFDAGIDDGNAAFVHHSGLRS